MKTRVASLFAILLTISAFQNCGSQLEAAKSHNDNDIDVGDFHSRVESNFGPGEIPEDKIPDPGDFPGGGGGSVEPLPEDKAINALNVLVWSLLRRPANVIDQNKHLNRIKNQRINGLKRAARDIAKSNEFKNRSWNNFGQRLITRQWAYAGLLGRCEGPEESPVSVNVSRTGFVDSITNSAEFLNKWGAQLLENTRKYPVKLCHRFKIRLADTCDTSPCFFIQYILASSINEREAVDVAPGSDYKLSVTAVGGSGQYLGAFFAGDGGPFNYQVGKIHDFTGQQLLNADFLAPFVLSGGTRTNPTRADFR